MTADDLTLHTLLERTIRVHRDFPALGTVGGEMYSYVQMYEQVRGVSQLLHEQGVLPGDRVAIFSENRPQWGIAYFAITTMGAVAVPILPDFHPNEIQHILRHSESRVLFVSARLYPRLEEMDLPRCTRIVLDDFAAVPPDTGKDRLAAILDHGRREFARFRESALTLAGKIPRRITNDTLAAIVYTSGTTGHSKGVMLTHGNMVADAKATAQIVTVTSSDRMLSLLPLAHTYECTLGLLTPIMLGASVHYLDRPPTAAVMLPALQRVKPTIVLSVPLIIEKIYKSRIHPQLSKNIALRQLMKIPAIRKRLHRVAGRKLLNTFGGELHLFCIGGAALAPDVEFFLREARFPYAIGYGLTETSPLVAGTDPSHTRYRSTGKALPGIQIRIADPDPETDEGEIHIRGPVVMQGYYQDPARTADVFTDDGWFRTGDLGVLDEEGYLYIRGRSKNVILGPSGKNIYPEEIEAALAEFDIVQESLVFQQGRQLVARVFLDYERLSTEGLSEQRARECILALLDGLRRDVNERLSSFSRLHRLIEQREPFEKTPTQKIKRHLYVTPEGT